MPRSGATRSGSRAHPPRRAPSPEGRQRDAERSRKRILDAAVEEFSTKGYAGARVAEIAARAGVNVQLITYYFGGKQGLYERLRSTWMAEEAVFAAPEESFSSVIDAYLNAVVERPSRARLLLWQALGDEQEQATDQARQASIANEIESIRRRQERGELAKDFDPEMIFIMLWSAVMAPVTMPRTLQEACGADFDSTAFRTRYASQLKRLFMGTSGDATVSR